MPTTVKPMERSRTHTKVEYIDVDMLPPRQSQQTDQKPLTLMEPADPPFSMDASTIDNTNDTVNQENTENEPSKIAINILIRGEDSIYIDPHFVKHLKNHQIAGIQFMWKQVMDDVNGCVLAHCMGLGKTLQVIVLVATLFQAIDSGRVTIPGDSSSKKILIIGPLITLTNWLNEFNKWLPSDIISDTLHIFNISDLGGVRNDQRVNYVRKWSNDGGVMLISYDQFRVLLTTSVWKSAYEEMLLKPSLVILDEAHRIKDRNAFVTLCVKKIETPRRICLTGYPLQNNLAEYYCMFDFIYPGLLGDEREFKGKFRKPIESIYADSSSSEKKYARLKLLELQLLTDGIIQRKDATILNKELPGKTEYFISLRLTPMQYKFYVKLLVLCKTCDASFLLVIMLFRCLCNHPAIFKDMLVKKSENQSANRAPTLSDTGLEVNDQDEYATVTAFAGKEMRDWKNYDDTENSDLENWNQSNKTRIILLICRSCKLKKEKLVIVSHSIATLNYIQTMLAVNDFAIARIDGTTPQGERQPIIDNFNDLESSEIMLLSAKAGGIGVNITGANRMILVDSDWNPSHDEQSIGRVYRYGQKKHVVIYRLFAYSTVESTILKQGSHKNGLSRLVVDNKLSRLHLKQELRQYYRPPKEIPSTNINPKNLRKIDDPVLKRILEMESNSVVEVRKNRMTSYENHNSLGQGPLDIASLKNVQHSVRHCLRNAKSQHRHTFRSHM